LTHSRRAREDSRMVEIQTVGDELRVNVLGFHKFLAFKGSLVVPRSAVQSARRLEPGKASEAWKGIRFPGSHIPGVLVAGTFHKGGERHFWDVRHGSRAIEIRLSGQRYNRLFVEVADPELVLRNLNVPEA
jgi:hypothetical protein